MGGHHTVTREEVKTWTATIDGREYEVHPQTNSYEGTTGLFHNPTAYSLPKPSYWRRHYWLSFSPRYSPSGAAVKRRLSRASGAFSWLSMEPNWARSGRTLSRVTLSAMRALP